MSDSVQPHRWQPNRLPCPWDSPGKNTVVGCHFLLQCMKVKSESQVAQSCPTLSDLMDCSLPGSSVHGIFQARILEWVPLPSPRILHNSPIKVNSMAAPEPNSEILFSIEEPHLPWTRGYQRLVQFQWHFCIISKRPKPQLHSLKLPAISPTHCSVFHSLSKIEMFALFWAPFMSIQLSLFVTQSLLCVRKKGVLSKCHS